MKKYLAILAVSAFAFFAACADVDASTGYRVSESNESADVRTIDGGDIYTGTINVTGANSGTFTYVYTNGLYINEYLLEGLKNVLKDEYAKLLNPSVGSELAFTDWYANYSTTGNVSAPGAGNKANWVDINSILRNVVVGRTASMSTNEDGEAVETVDESEMEGTANGKGSRVTFEYKVSAENAYEVVNGQLVKSSKTSVTNVAYDIYHSAGNKFVSPLVMDMTGEGKLQASNGQHMPHKTVDMSNVILADFYGDGFEIGMEWVGPQDGLLVAPKADGTVDMSTLFGTAGGYESGYEKLSLFDKNNDGVISGAELAGLAIWQDANGNGVADAGEVTKVSELGVTKINLNHNQFVSSFERNGETFKMWDWWPSAVELQKMSSK